MKALLMLPALLLIMLSSACTTTKSALRPDGTVDDAERNQALKYFREGSEALFNDDALALEKFKKSLSIDKSLVPAYFNAGISLQNLRRFDEAVGQYQACLLIDKKNAPCIDNLVALLHQLQRTAELDSLLKNLQTDFPDQAFVNVALAKRAFLDGNLNVAESRARAAIEVVAENVEALYVMARIFFARKQYGAAKWVAKNALEISPSHGGLWLILGHTLVEQELLADAIDAYAQAIKFQSTPEVLESYAWLLLKRGRAVDALPLLEKLVRLDPQDYKNHLNVGNAYMATRQFEKARQAFLKVLELAPERTEAQYNLGLLYFDFKPENMPELERLKISNQYFLSYLKTPGLPKSRVKEANKYLSTLKDQITRAEFAAEAEEEPIEEEVAPVEEENPSSPPPLEEPTPEALPPANEKPKLDPEKPKDVFDEL
jgi:tetratricopeptide (TPR) repeat protein